MATTKQNRYIITWITKEFHSIQCEETKSLVHTFVQTTTDIKEEEFFSGKNISETQFLLNTDLSLVYELMRPQAVFSNLSAKTKPSCFRLHPSREQQEQALLLEYIFARFTSSRQQVLLHNSNVRSVLNQSGRSSARQTKMCLSKSLFFNSFKNKPSNFYLKFNFTAF